MTMQYKNNRGESIPVHITFHALDRFKERYERLTGTKLSESEARARIENLFRISRKMTADEIGRHLRTRSKKHNSDSLYFVANDWRFIVANSALVTVELASASARGKNKSNGGLWGLIERANNFSYT